MGVLLTPIILKKDLALDDLRGRRFAVDANGELYQFLALIRLRDGSPLQDSHGRALAEGIMGKQAPDFAHSYFRFPHQPNVYLAHGVLPGDLGKAEPHYWLRREQK